MWERRRWPDGEWVEVAYLREVPKSVIRRWNRWVLNGEVNPEVPTRGCIYRFVYCV